MALAERQHLHSVFNVLAAQIRANRVAFRMRLILEYTELGPCEILKLNELKLT